MNARRTREKAWASRSDKEQSKPYVVLSEPVPLDASVPPGNEPDSPLDQIQSLYNEGRDDDTLKLAEEHLRVFPDDTTVLLILARVLNRKQQWPEALNTWQKLAVLLPQFNEAHLQVARGLSRQRNWDGAVEAAARLLSIDSTHAEGLNISCNALLNLKLCEEAVAPCLKLLETGSSVGEQSGLRLAEHLFDNNHPEHCAKVVSYLVRAFPTSETILTLRSRILTSLSVDASAYSQEEDPLNAAAYCRMILMIDPADVRAAAMLAAAVAPTLTEARAAYKQEDWADAERKYMEILSLNPRHSEAIRALGRVHNHLKNWPEAMVYWGQLEQLTPEDPEPPLQMARSCYRTERFEEALPRYRRLVEAGGEAAKEAAGAILNVLANLFRQAALKEREGDLQESYRLATLVTQLQPENENVIKLLQNLGQTFLREAEALFKQEDFAAALTNAERAHTIEPENTAPLLILARSAHRVGEYKSALSAWERLAVLQPDKVEPLFQCARYYHRFKDDDSALPTLKRALALAPDHKEANRLLSDLNAK